jgi:hypothetical protein
VRLDSGTLRLTVHRKAGEARLLVEVPDGWIEDQGTQFSVTVQFGRTQCIEVKQGAVVFHRHDGAIAQVRGGEVWQRAEKEPTPQASAACSAADHWSPEATSGAAARLTSAPAKHAQTQSRGKAAGRDGWRVREAAPGPSASVAPESGSEEDLAYLKLLALLGEGRGEEARLAAKEYLRRFPAGFRRIEVERLAR